MVHRLADLWAESEGGEPYVGTEPRLPFRYFMHGLNARTKQSITPKIQKLRTPNCPDILPDIVPIHYKTARYRANAPDIGPNVNR